MVIVILYNDYGNSDDAADDRIMIPDGDIWWEKRMRRTHDGVMKYKHFPHYLPFVRETTGHQWIPVTKERPVMRSFDVSFDVNLRKQLNKRQAN